MPPLLELKKLVFMFRSVRIIVIPPASTGKDRTSRNTVVSMVHTNKAICSRLLEFKRIFFVVLMKLIPPRIELTPARCRPKIRMSIDWS